ncbi:MAG: hypothetical protein GXW91_08655 [Clostridiales bacterium]|nr:hypothetical protein [Clostridiales bacterium]
MLGGLPREHAADRQWWGGHAADKRGHVKQHKVEAKQKTAGTVGWTCNPRGS